MAALPSYELELEAQDPARFLPDLRELLDDHEIAWRAQTRTKYRRFLDRHRPHPERVWRRLLDRGDLLGVWLALVAIAGVLAYDRSGDVVNVLGVDFKTPQAVAAALVGLNFFLILVSRGADARRRLGGVRSLYHEQASGYLRRMGWPASSAAPLKHDIERGTGNAITKLSIMSAIAAGMVAILLQLPGADQPVAGDDLLRQVAVLGLSVTVVCMLIAILCYDYSQRFTWPDALRLELHRKGFRYDVWSWYGLLIFFILALATVHPIISIVVNGIYGVILWHFYYFSREAVTTLVASTRAP